MRPRVWSNYRNFYNDRITVGQPMKRYQKILVRQNRAPGTRRNRAGRKAKQGRAQSETGPDADTGITGKDPPDGKQPKMPLKAFFLI